MAGHYLGIVGEDTFHSPPPDGCDSNSRTVEPTADNRPLAASAYYRHS